MTTIEVCTAIICRENLVLISQRKKDRHQGLKWEFPGGKVESGETHEQALKREIREELGLDIHIHERVHETTYTYPERCVRLHFYRCSTQGDQQPKALDVLSYKWVAPRDLERYDFPPANDAVLKKLQAWEAATPS